MPQATPTHTRNPVAVALQPAACRLQAPVDRDGLTYQDAILRDACRAAATTQKAMVAMSLSVADLAADDPVRGAANAAVARLRPQWAHEIQQASTVPAAGPSGLRDKAELLGTLIDRDEDGTVLGGPVLSLAASLAADVLQQHWAATA